MRVTLCVLNSGEHCDDRGILAAGQTQTKVLRLRGLALPNAASPGVGALDVCFLACHQLWIGTEVLERGPRLCVVLILGVFSYLAVDLGDMAVVARVFF